MSVADDSAEEHGHLPAVEDWPKGFGEASWWPFITAAGAAGIYAGVALFIIAMNPDIPVPSVAGPVAIIGATGMFLVGLYGWTYHAFISHFWSRETHEAGASALRWGMIAFLGSEIATFGAGFVYYFFIRVGTWPPAGSELPHLLSSLVLVNTGILILSSLTLHWAHVELRKDNRRNFIIGLGATLLLGVVFIGGQVLEYYEFIVNEGFSIGNPTPIFESAFYGLTGLHGLHVSLGAVLLAIVFVRALLGQYSAHRHVSVTTVSMYWHFVDVVWVFLVVVIYLGATL